jgi:2-methylcitrate dehydratase PrpD
LLRLDAAKIRNALGIAYSQVAGNVQAVHDAALTKRMQPAFGAKAGVLSAYLAARGITGAKEVFEGKFGLFNVYHRGSFDRRQLVSDLGSRFEVVNLSLKPYPCCRFTHTSIDATLDLVNQFDLKPNEVQDVKVSVTRQANIVCEPEETRKRPKTVVDAQFSIPYTVANAIVKRKVFIEDFSEVELKNEEVLSLAQRVITRYDDEMYQEWGRGITPAIVEIYLKSGESLSKRVDYPKGHPVNPLSDSDLVDKFKRCADHACKVLSPQVLDEAIDMLLELNNMENICDFLQHF